MKGNLATSLPTQKATITHKDHIGRFTQRRTRIRMKNNSLPFQLQAFSLHKVKKQKRYQFSWKLYFIVFRRIVNLNLFGDAD